MFRLCLPLCAAIQLLIFSPASVADEFGVEVIFGHDEVKIIQAYYKRPDALSKHGHKKHKGLPPGIAKNLRRGKALPPGIAKQRLPDDLRHSLPPVRDGYERVIIDGRILLIEVATQIVHDVLSDIVIG